MTTPQTAALARIEHPILPIGGAERFDGWGAMGAPYGDGHYLALRVLTASSVCGTSAPRAVRACEVDRARLGDIT